MATLLRVAQLGQPILRQNAKPIANIHDHKIQTLIKNLTATLMDANGVGIGAPQVYESLRLFIVASHPNPRYPNAPQMEPTPMINPKIVSHSKTKTKDWEGCLSIPGIRGLIPRYTKITISYTDRHGNKQKKTFENFIARIVEHENDHLDGIVFLDKVENMKEIITEKEYQRLMASKK